MSEFLPIHYSGFWDVPDAFLTVFKGELYYFDRGYFDDELDDYPPNYKVYLVRNVKLEDSFELYEFHDPPIEAVKFINTELLKQNKVIGEVPTKEVIFDKTKRKFVDSEIIEKLLTKQL